MVKFRQVLHFSTPKKQIKKDIDTIHALFDDYQSYLDMQINICHLADNLRQSDYHNANHLSQNSLKIKREDALPKTIITCIKTLINQTKKRILTEKSYNQTFSTESDILCKLKERLNAL